jgi:hypothetical protein
MGKGSLPAGREAGFSDAQYCLGLTSCGHKDAAASYHRGSRRSGSVGGCHASATKGARGAQVGMASAKIGRGHYSGCDCKQGKSEPLERGDLWQVHATRDEEATGNNVRMTNSDVERAQTTCGHF